MYRLWQILLLFVTYVFFSSNEAQAILTKKEAAGSVVQHSFTVAIRRDYMYYCSGAIISKRCVLTAAHCVYHEFDEESRHQPLEVVLGTTNYFELGPTGLVISVERIFVPKEYLSVIDQDIRVADIAVLKLAADLDLSLKNRALSKLFLPELDQSYIKSKGYITGFGWDWPNAQSKIDTNQINEQEDSSGKLRALHTTVIQSFNCQSAYKFPIDDKRFVCARVTPTHPKSAETATIGDGGGPLVFNGDTVIGILSSFIGKEWNGKIAPLLYTRVSAYGSFIQKATKDTVDHNVVVIDLPCYKISPASSGR